MMDRQAEIENVVRNTEKLAHFCEDDDFIQYIASVISDVTDWSSEDQLCDALSEILIGYSVCENAKEAVALCQQIHARLTNTNKDDIRTENEQIKKLTDVVKLKDRVQHDMEERIKILSLSEGLAGTNLKEGFHLVNSAIDRTDELMRSSGYKKEQVRRNKIQNMVYTYNGQQSREEALEGIQKYMNARRNGGSKDVNVSNVSILTPDNRVLLDNATLRLPYGRRFGLIGHNGIGKTTLLRHMAAYAIDGFPQHLKVLHVEQEVVGDERSVLQTVLDSDLERIVLLGAESDLMKKVESGDCTAAEARELEYVHRRLDELEAWSAEARAASILAGLNIKNTMQAEPTSIMSGGWRMRVALAAALFVRPDILLLDEPTNHLDFPTTIWLQEYLVQYPATVVVVSHDRGFLDNIATDIIHLRSKMLTYYKGNYSQFTKTQNEQYIAEKKAYEAQRLQVAHIEDFITTYYTEKKSSAQANKTKMVESRKKILEKMEYIEDPDKTGDAPPIQFYFPDPEGALRKDLLVQTESLSFGYPNSPMLFRNVTIQIEKKSRIGMLGANGVGKSTLIQLIMGRRQPVSGHITINSNCRMALFAQHHVDALDLAQTPADCLRMHYPDMEVQEVRRYLGKFGITEQMPLMQIGYLSGGQKSRIAFSLIVREAPHLVILDEPTNNLDLESVDSLIKAIHEFMGAIVVVSHDQYFLQAVARVYWAVGDTSVCSFDKFEQAKAHSYR